jgi:TatD DNase family protein
MADSGLVDFHCHLDLYPDHAAAVMQCERAEIFTLAVTTTPRAWPRNQELTEPTKYVRTALGLHPQLVAERAGELGLWEELLPRARYVGEVGLDAGPQFYHSFEQQKEVFRHILRTCARVGGKILTIHSVRSTKTVLDMIEEYLPASRGRAVLHWFTGTQSEARRAIELGCYFSVNAQMLRSQRQRPIVSSLPIDRILTETDGPFVKVAQRSATPLDIPATLEALALARGVQTVEIQRAIRTNLKTLVSDV